MRLIYFGRNDWLEGVPGYLGRNEWGVAVVVVIVDSKLFGVLVFCIDELFIFLSEAEEYRKLFALDYRDVDGGIMGDGILLV